MRSNHLDQIGRSTKRKVALHIRNLLGENEVANLGPLRLGTTRQPSKFFDGRRSWVPQFTNHTFSSLYGPRKSGGLLDQSMGERPSRLAAPKRNLDTVLLYETPPLEKLRKLSHPYWQIPIDEIHKPPPADLLGYSFGRIPNPRKSNVTMQARADPLSICLCK